MSFNLTRNRLVVRKTLEPSMNIGGMVHGPSGKTRTAHAGCYCPFKRMSKSERRLVGQESARYCGILCRLHQSISSVVDHSNCLAFSQGQGCHEPRRCTTFIPLCCAGNPSPDPMLAPTSPFPSWPPRLLQTSSPSSPFPSSLIAYTSLSLSKTGLSCRRGYHAQSGSYAG